jgi:hypothetical protein
VKPVPVKFVNPNQIKPQSNANLTATTQSESGPAKTDNEEIPSKQARHQLAEHQEQQPQQNPYGNKPHLKKDQERGKERTVERTSNEYETQRVNVYKELNKSAYTTAASLSESQQTHKVRSATTLDERQSGDPTCDNSRKGTGVKLELWEEGPHEPVMALVSNAESLNKDMLRAVVNLGSDLPLAHLDSCATHCFLSKAMSYRLTNKGWSEYTSSIKYAVQQGNPLCITSIVQILPLTMVRNDGTVAHWNAVLFVVADCGADVIIGYPTLRCGGIINYDPPEQYQCILRPYAQAAFPSSEKRELASSILRQGRAHQYEPPEEERQLRNKNSVLNFAGNFRTDAAKKPLRVSGSALNFEQKSDGSLLDETKLNVKQSNKPEIAALTASEPYGKNPPLPEEVMTALRLLKDLAEEKPQDNPEELSEELKQMRRKLQEKRPAWANFLTMRDLEEVSDEPTERLIHEMMDRPKYQKSIFQTAMHLDTTSDFKEFEIISKPGKDEWNPPQPRRYRNPNTMRIVDDWLDTLLKNNKCRKSKATHPAPVTVVERTDREPRVCLDYRNRNHRTEVPIYPMPNVHDFLDDAGGFSHYCSFDMASMFTQFKMKEEHKHLASFITHRGVYEPEVVMFGLAGAPQHAVREVGGSMAEDPRINGTTYTEWAKEQNDQGEYPPYDICPFTKIVKGSRLRPFIDDVFLKSNHSKGMVKMVELFFDFCMDHHLILKRKKALIMKRRLKTLGFVVSKEGKHLDPSRIITLLESALPRSRETLHSMLSSFTFVRMFIPNFASIAAPLYEATKGIIWKGPQSGKSKGTRMIDPDFVWTDEMKRAYEQLKAALLDAPILVSPDYSIPLFLSVDASLRGEGWVLWQLIRTEGGRLVAVAILYGSRKYTHTEQKWETTRQEATAIRSALQDVEEYVFGQHFYLFSDHLNLRFMHNSVNRAVLRMRDFLCQFNMTVVHCPGAWNNADSVSRLETEELPISLAANLNSATEAIMREEGDHISRGTDTDLDHISDTDVVITVSSDKNAERVTALCSGSCPLQYNEFECLLCNLHLIEVEVPMASDIHPDDMVGEMILRTEAEVQEWINPDFEPIISQILMTNGCSMTKDDLDTLRHETETWNSHPTYPKDHGGIILPFDNETDEDLEWCGEIDRTSIVYRSTAKPLTLSIGSAYDLDQPSANPLELSLPLTSSDNSNKRKTVTFQGSPVDVKDEGAADSPSLSRMISIRDEGTQTTPADFRMATIQVPMLEDFKAIHNDISGHHGLDFSYRKLLKRCGSKWANERGEASKIKRQLKEFIDGCPTCQKLRGLREKIKCKHSFIISRPFLEVSYDFIIFKNPDRHGNRYLLAAIDNFSKLVEMKAVAHRDAETVAQFLLEIASRYGHCARLRSDNEASFVSQIITKLNKNRGTETKPCIPYRPEANSIIERQNAITTFHLSALILGCNLGPQSKVGWSELIPTVFSIVNNTPKNPLGISPLSLVYGVFANYDRPLLDPSNNKIGDRSNPLDYVDNLMIWQNKLLDLAEDIQSRHFERLNQKLNRTQTSRKFNQGDFVLQQKDSTGITGKPSSRWIGPFLVLERPENDPMHPVLELMNLTDMTKKQAAADDCRIFNTSWFEDDTIIHELAKIAAKDLDEYVVEKILDHRPTGEVRKLPLSKYFFLVKWVDFDEPTWEPYSGIKNLEPLDQYGRAHPELKIPILE